MKFIPKQSVDLQELKESIKTQEKVLVENQIKEYTEGADMTEFNAACEKFKKVCSMIGEFLGQSNFTGGFDEAIALLESKQFDENPTQGIILFSLWQGVDKLCTYTAAKVGIGQPSWWYRCWGLKEE